MESASREWKPGDLARTIEGANVFLVQSGGDGDERHWMTDESGRWPGDPTTLRPLVTVDPEDDERIGRLTETWLAAFYDKGTATHLAKAEAMRAALRGLLG